MDDTSQVEHLVIREGWFDRHTENNHIGWNIRLLHDRTVWVREEEVLRRYLDEDEEE